MTLIDSFADYTDTIIVKNNNNNYLYYILPYLQQFG